MIWQWYWPGWYRLWPRWNKLRDNDFGVYHNYFCIGPFQSKWYSKN